MRAKKNRPILVNKSMNDMVVGEKGFFDGEGIYFIRGKCYIDTNFSVSPKKNNIHTVPIERIGSEKGDFELDFFTIEIFFPKYTTQQIYDILHDNAVMLIEDIEIEVCTSLIYQTKMFPRMDWEELMANFIASNEILEINPDDKNAMYDKENLIICIKKTLCEYDVAELKIHEKEFTEPTPKEKAEGIINFLADENILRYIKKRIAMLEEKKPLQKEKTKEVSKDKAFKDMSMDELNTALELSIQTENYGHSALIRDEIGIRQKVGT